MKVPIRWLSDYVELTTSISEIAHRLTMAGLEVTGIVRTGSDWENVVVGEVMEVKPHPDADRLRLVTVNIAEETFEVVCGAPNVAEGQRIAYARLGARLIDARSGEKKKLKKAKIRGVVSVGMICSELELGLSDEHEGILVLSPNAKVGQPISDVLGDTVMDIDMKPNRSDGLSVLGVAREVGALIGATVTEPELDCHAVGVSIEGRAAAEILDSDLCARFTLALIEDITIKPSPSWMQERLLAAGMRPINNVVDITNYIMLELGQPIHAFDYHKIRDGKIVVRRAKEGETLITLDGKERSFSASELLITDSSGPIAVAGVMGGFDTEVTDSTQSILLEVGNFDPVSIRRTAMKLKLPSEASRRFAWGISPALAPMASKRATKLLVELADGKAAAGMVDTFPVKPDPVIVHLRKKRIPQVLGVDPPEEQVTSSLTSLGFAVTVANDAFTVTAPYWRRDVSCPDDVVEEVARVIGYDHIPAEPLAGRVPPRVPQPVRELRERTRDILVEAGMQEVITYPLTSMEVLQRVVAPESLGEPLAIINPLNVGQERMRTSLRASVLECLAKNLRVARGQLALFEVARVYLPGEGALPEENEHIVGVVTGARIDRWRRPTAEFVDFFDIKSYPMRLFERLSVKVSVVAQDDYGLLSGRSAALFVGDDRVGTVGQVHPDTARSFGLEQATFLFELKLEVLLSHVPSITRYKPVSKYPTVEEDLALVISQTQDSESVLQVIQSHPLVASARVFDEYVGEQVSDGKKSLAIGVSFQAPDRTLTDRDVAKAREKIMARLERTLGAELR